MRSCDYSKCKLRDLSSISRIVLHYTASKEYADYTPLKLESDHLQRGFIGCGYHYYIREDGTLCKMRPIKYVGAHAKGHNADSIGICLEGGFTRFGKPWAGPNEAQLASLQNLINQLREQLNKNLPMFGHRELCATACPGFDVLTLGMSFTARQGD